jgi:hypothetical protein
MTERTQTCDKKIFYRNKFIKIPSFKLPYVITIGIKFSIILRKKGNFYALEFRSKSLLQQV